MELTMENTVEYTEYMLREYYHLNTEPMFSVLDRNVMWIGPGSEFAFGRAEVKNYFKDGFVMPPMDLEDAEFFSIKDGRNTRIVVGRYIGRSAPDAEQILAGSQRVTMHYSQSGKDKPVRLIHMHVSNQWNELVEDEVFPVKVSVQTYRYVQQMLAEARGRRPYGRIELITNGTAHYVDSGTVVYLEAVGKYTVIHFTGKCITVRKSIGEVAPCFPENFYRAHRGYLINCDYVDSIGRYAIILITGMIIPIPEKRYTQVRREMMDLMRKNSCVERK